MLWKTWWWTWRENNQTHLFWLDLSFLIAMMISFRGIWSSKTQKMEVTNFWITINSLSKSWITYILRWLETVRIVRLWSCHQPVRSLISIRFPNLQWALKTSRIQKWSPLRNSLTWRQTQVCSNWMIFRLVWSTLTLLRTCALECVLRTHLQSSFWTTRSQLKTNQR